MSVPRPASAAGTFSCLLAREAYPGRENVSFRALRVGRDNKYLVRWKVREVA
jgi:hypothetical protein